MEMAISPNMPDSSTSRSLHRERGWKCAADANQQIINSGRSLHRERGWKYRKSTQFLIHGMSLPSQGAWMEIAYCRDAPSHAVSLPSQGAWMEMA